ncbi:hypothetical protein JCM10213_004116 [Rhodosporidiobolus nylandii]
MAAVDGADSSSNAKANDGIDSARIGWAFLSQYYSFLNRDPARLHCFYTKRSTLIHSTEGEDTTACYGQQEIHSKIMALGFDDCKVYISNVDSQSSADGGIIVQVIGEMSNANGPWRKFAQTFFLAEQPSGYFVLNDICRYIKEEGDETEASPAPAAAAPAAAQPEPAQSQPQPEQAEAQPVSFEEAPAKEEAPAAPAAVEEPAAATEASADSFTFHGDKSLIPPATNGAAPEEEQEEKAPAQEEAAPEPVVEAPEPTPEPVAEQPKPAAEAEKPAAAPAPAEEAPAPTPAAPAEPVAAPTPAAVPAVAPPVAAATPKTWATLAASGVNKWGQISNQSKGVSAAAPPPAPAPAAERPAPAAAAPTQAGPGLVDAVLAINTPSCFVKGVVETVSEKALRDVLTTRFGALKEVDIVRSKACAFVEFEKLDAARRAIQVSLRPSEGGEGGIFIEVGQAQPARINVVERKPHGDRPISNRTRGGGAVGGQQGGQRRQEDGQGAPSGRGGRGGSTGGRGGRGGRGGAKVGAQPAK